MNTNPNKLNDSNEGIAQLEIVAGSSAVLHFADRQISAAIGRSGVRTDKHEGDGATPSGLLPLRRVLYRADRIDRPKTTLLCEPLTENDGWCDDPTHPDYNHQIHLPHPAHHGKLWTEHHLFDIAAVLGYNDGPIVPGRGSGIFLHVARPDMSPSGGCIVVTLNDIYWLLEHGLQAIIVPNPN